MSKYLELFKGSFNDSINEKTKPENKPYIGYSLTDGKLAYTVVPKPVTGPADNEIWYTTVDGTIYKDCQISKFNTSIVSNTYENGKGIIMFTDTLTHLYDEDGMPNGAFGYQGEGAQIDTIYFPNKLKYIGKGTITNQSPSVSYNGTKEQWSQIEKNSMWYCGSDKVVVHCIDGDITL